MSRPRTAENAIALKIKHSESRQQEYLREIVKGKDYATFLADEMSYCRGLRECLDIIRKEKDRNGS